MIISLVAGVAASGVKADGCVATWDAVPVLMEKASLELTGDLECSQEDASCRLSFGLADQGSREIYADLRHDLMACPDLRHAKQDVGVNHPDFYDAWRFEFSGVSATLSIKDKSALGETYIVLRIRPRF